ncbi:MAG: hypothetical protein AB8D78_05660 [Akkermansiaceae bacterium]
MQNYCKTIGALAAASALVAGTASAEIEYEIHTGYTSSYIFRGLDLGDNLTEFGLDMAYDYNGVALSSGIWAGMFNNTGTGNQIDLEVDFYTEAAYDFGYATGAIGYIYYWNVGALGADAGEVYFSLSREFYGFDTSFTYFYDVHGAGIENDGYSEFYVGKSHELNSCLTWNNGLTVGFTWEQTDITHVQFKTGLDWAASETATISPFLAYSWGVGSEGNVWGNVQDEFFAGSMLSVSF